VTDLPSQPGSPPAAAGVKDFFISYTGADRGWAEWIAWHLEEKRYTTILQAWDFGAGSNFVVAMHRASIQAQRTLLVVSERSLASGYVEAEWAARFAQDPRGEGRRLLPVRIEACDIGGLLGQIVYVDLVGLEPDQAQAALLAGVATERAKPPTAPAFPGGAQRSVPRPHRFPGALPDVWNLPHRRNPNFTGREDLLADLHASLASGGPAAITQAISGLGGVGKTQLATEYAYRNAVDYDVVWWVRSEEATSLATDYARGAQALGLPEQNLADQAAVVEAVKRWFGTHPRWLLVFDNATGPKDLRPYLPQGGGGHVLITSRYPSWRGMATPLPLQPMLPDEAVAFIARRTGRSDDDAARSLAEALGYLPLALEQACAYMEETGADVARYLGLFAQRRKELLARASASPTTLTPSRPPGSLPSTGREPPRPSC